MLDHEARCEKAAVDAGTSQRRDDPGARVEEFAGSMAPPGLAGDRGGDPVGCFTYGSAGSRRAVNS